MGGLASKEYSVIAYIKWMKEGNATYGRLGYEAASKTWRSKDLQVDLAGKNFPSQAQIRGQQCRARRWTASVPWV